MDIYVLDANFEKLDLVENFTSFIWTERWNTYGDFKLKFPYRSRNTQYLYIGRYLYIDDSRTLMRIERYERDSDDSEDLVEVSGRSVLSLFTDKIVTPRSFRQHAPTIPQTLVNSICVLGNGVSNLDIIPNLSIDWHSDFGDIIDYEVGYVNLYDEILELSNEHDFGYRLDFIQSIGGLRFRTIQGFDRTDELVFCQGIGNLEGLNILRTSEDYKNVAYVTSKDRENPMVVYRRNHSGASGIDRRVVHVEVSESDPTDAAMRRAGRQAMSPHRYVAIMDGKAKTDTIRYDRDYYLGDLVRINDVSGRTSEVRVTEYIWSYDQDGFQEYPTFTSDSNYTWRT